MAEKDENQTNRAGRFYRIHNRSEEDEMQPEKLNSEYYEHPRRKRGTRDAKWGRER